TTTSSPARSLRISCSSLIGNVTSCVAICSGLPVEVDGAVGGDVRGRATRGPALVVDRDGIQRHVRVGVLDVAVVNGNVAAEPHRADAGLVQEVTQLVLELRDYWIGVTRSYRPGACIFIEVNIIVYISYVIYCDA